MKLGFIGLGKLGMPVAICLSKKHQVTGYDVAYDFAQTQFPPQVWPHRETGPDGKEPFQPHYAAATDRPVGRPAHLQVVASVAQAVKDAELIFLAVQTPHGPEYEGITPLPDTRADFDYSYLIQAVKEVCEHVTPDQILVIISTVLPGTLRREILPITQGKCQVVYNPGFPAMGTVMRDFMRPEFVLLGAEDNKTLRKVEDFYLDLYDGDGGFLRLWREGSSELISMSIESAELAKVAYNCALTLKIMVANTLMEICHKTPGCNVDDVIGVLKAANRRIVSTAYMDAGGEDGGGCHPRDNIAMSYLARKLNLSQDIFGEAMAGREARSKWLAGLVTQYAFNPVRLPIVIFGKAYKPESNLTAGSPALLVANILKDWGVEFQHYDPFVDDNSTCPGTADGKHSFQPLPPSVFLIATKHEFFRTLEFPAGSVVIDPHRYIQSQDGVKIIPVGVGQ